MRPRTIGRYEIVRPLASGGMAEVLLARIRGPRGFERPVVVKRILPVFSADRAFTDMFFDEARIVARLSHPNVVHVHELVREGGECFIVMEYLHGESVWSLARRLTALGETFPHDLAAFVVSESCAGLHAAHELKDESGASLGVVHRDVSPQNLFVTFEGAVKVIDFGVAKARDRVTANTEIGVLKGKLGYMSPEQCTMQHEVDRRSDVFALGAVLYELLTGRAPFKREGAAATLRALLDDPVEPPKSRVPALDRICMRALARDRAARYPTALEMRRELVDAIQQAGRLPGEELAALMRRAFPPDEPTRVPPPSIPAPRYSTTIIGRNAELDAVEDAIDAGARVVTVLGLGGVGKTRLATAFAEQRADARGVIFADVASARSGADLCAVVARTLAIRADESPLQPLSDRIGDVLSRRGGTLVVIDNFEQLSRDAASCVRAWSVAAPEAVFVVTSRRPLEIEGEHMVPIGPLELTAADALFVARARTRAHALGPDDAPLVSEIVRRLEGLPLAIELAAARLDVLPLRGLAERLGARFSLLRNPSAPSERHGTLLQALEWSWDLLTEPQRRALACLSVFEGRFELEDVEALEQSLDEVHALVRHSLVNAAGGGRMVLLDTVREYAAQKLDDSEAVHARHARHFLERGVSLARTLDKADDPVALASLERYRADLMAVMVRALDRKDGAEAAKALAALAPVLVVRIPADERLALVDRVLACPSSVEDEHRLLAAYTRAVSLVQLGRADEASATLDRALPAARAQGFAAVEAQMLEQAAMAAGVQGHAEQARELARASARTFASIGDARGEARGFYRLAMFDTETGDFEAAAKDGQRALDIFQSAGDTAGVIRAHIALGANAYEHGDSEGARPFLERAALMAKASGERMQRAIAEGYLGDVAHEQEDWDKALELYESAREVFEATATRRLEAIYIGYIGIARAKRGELDEGAALIERARASLSKMQDPRYGATMEAALVGVRALAGDTTGAREALSAIRASVADKVNATFSSFVDAYEAIIDATQGDIAEAERRSAAALRGPVEARLAVSFITRAIREARDRSRTWSFDAGGRAFRSPSSDAVRLDTHGPLTRLLAALVGARVDHPDSPVDRDALIAAGWPDEAKLSAASARNRLKVAMSTLRKAGLTILVTRDGGYMLDASVPITTEANPSLP